MTTTAAPVTVVLTADDDAEIEQRADALTDALKVAVRDLDGMGAAEIITRALRSAAAELVLDEVAGDDASAAVDYAALSDAFRHND